MVPIGQARRPLDCDGPRRGEVRAGDAPERVQRADHKWTFTIRKSHSWSKHSCNLIDLIHELGPAADLIKIEQLTGTYRFGLPRQDQTRTPIGEAAIEFIVRKRRQTEIEAGASSPIVNIKHATKPKIALHRPGAYGDIIMTLALVPLLKQKYPDHEIHYYCNATIGKQLAGLMQAAGVNAAIDCTLLTADKAAEYQRVVNLVGYPLAEGYPEKPMSMHLIEYFAEEMSVRTELDKIVGWRVPHLTLARPPRPDNMPTRYATIHPQAGWSVYKQWPKDRWESIVAERPDILFFQIGSETDARINGTLPSFMGKPFYDSISLLANSSLHIGVDTWTNHLTNIEWEDEVELRYFVPAIILWGSTQWQAAGYSRNTNISLGLPCPAVLPRGSKDIADAARPVHQSSGTGLREADARLHGRDNRRSSFGGDRKGMAEMTENCASCKFYVKEPLRPGYGECHVGRPTLAIVMSNQGPTSLGGWPPTQEKFWCGEHKPKTNGSSQ